MFLIKNYIQCYFFVFCRRNIFATTKLESLLILYFLKIKIPLNNVSNLTFRFRFKHILSSRFKSTDKSTKLESEYLQKQILNLLQSHLSTLQNHQHCKACSAKQVLQSKLIRAWSVSVSPSKSIKKDFTATFFCISGHCL